jgi:hypothetical protein
MASVKITELSSSGPLTGMEVLPIVQGNETVKVTVQEIANLGGGGGLEGTQYIYVAANGTDIENAAELQAAYDLAKTMSPSASNRITVIAAPGNYKFPSTFVMDTEFIDLVSLTGNPDVVLDIQLDASLNGDPFNYISTPFSYILSECIVISNNNIYVKGIKGKTYSSPTYANWFYSGPEYVLPIWIENNLDIKLENCIGGYMSFGGDKTEGSNPPININGIFINCDVINGSGFGGAFSGNANGYFENCNVVGQFQAFGHYSSNGVFVNCSTGGQFSRDNVTGTFINCTGQNFSFGLVNSSGTFTNCKAGDWSFGSGFGSGAGLNASGTFTNCKAGDWSFGSGTGTFTNCEAGDYSFGAANLANGTYNYCIAGFGSFGTNMNPSISGQLYYCRLTSGTFQTVTGAGKTVYCVDGNGDPNNQGFTPQNKL